MVGTGSPIICLTSASGTRLFRRDDGGLVLQFFEAACGHDRSWTDALDGRHAAIHSAGLNGPHVRDAFVDDVYERRLSVVLDGVSRNQRNAFQRLDKKLG